MATVGPFADFHLWLFPVPKNMIGLPRVGPPMLALHMLGGTFDSGPRVSQIFLSFFFPFIPHPHPFHCERPLGAVSGLSGFRVTPIEPNQALHFHS